MKICGIISEYNPFHNGHLFQIQETRKKGATHIIAVMSGNFVQRGDAAIIDKFKRAELAVKNGIDLVIELPVIYSLSTAETFARGGISILSQLSCVDSISFGSECGDSSLLKKSAQISEEFSNSEELKELLKEGFSFPSAIEKLCYKKYGTEISSVFSSPNNLLGIEYIKAINYFNSDIKIETISRKSVMHDSNSVTDNFASASLIRKMIEKNKDIKNLTPLNVYEAVEDLRNNGELHFLKNLESSLLYKMRMMTEDDFKALNDVSQGLENRFFNAVKNSHSVEDLLFNVKTKRYPLSKLRRILLNAYLGIEKKDIIMPSPYARILAMNDKGCEILKQAKEKSSIPISTSLLKLSETSQKAKKLAMLEARATDIYNLSSNKKEKCGLDYTVKITKI